MRETAAGWSVTAKGAVTTLDPRSPLVLDLHALGRRAGSKIDVTRTVPAPADLGVAMARVPEGSDISLQVQCESAGEGVWVTGSVDCTVVGECSRCLEPIDWPQQVSFAELFAYPPTDHRGARIEVAYTDEGAEPAALVEDDLIDLEPIVRDAVVLALPLAPICDEQCAGLCPQCGVRLEVGHDHHHEVLDPRWDALRSLAAGLDDTSAAPPTAPFHARPDDDKDR
jgi:uncharacterized protein